MSVTNETPQNTVKSTQEEMPQMHGLVINPEDISKMNTEANQLLQSIMAFDKLQQQAENVKCKYGPGTRLYGFIEKTKNVAMANQQYSPGLFSATELATLVDQIEPLRNLKDKLNMIESITKNLLMLTTHEAYRRSLHYYNSVGTLAKRNIGGAKGIYDELHQYFERTAKPAAEPTRRQLERDMHALLNGTKDGKIVIKNQRPQTIGGVRTVEDNTHSNRSALRSSVDEEMN